MRSKQIVENEASKTITKYMHTYTVHKKQLRFFENNPNILEYLNNINDAIMITNDKKPFIIGFVNKKWVTDFNYDSKSVIGKTPRSIFNRYNLYNNDTVSRSLLNTIDNDSFQSCKHYKFLMNKGVISFNINKINGETNMLMSVCKIKHNSFCQTD